MAIRNIRTMDEEVLRKKSKEVKVMTPRTKMLIGDMLDTMYEAGGVGLAAPQVGVLKRIVFIDIGDGAEPLVMINPVIYETSGEQTADEGCLSLAGKCGQVTRPNVVKVRFQDEHMDQKELVAEELLARAICHECDHLDGILYIDLVEGELRDATYEEDDEEE